MTGALVVFAKAPRPGGVKTRLCPPLEPEQAAALYEALLGDVLEASAGFARVHGLSAVLAVHPPEACRTLAEAAPPLFRVVAQRGRDLGERMEWAVRECAAAGETPVLLRGSDSPMLDADTVAEALAALARCDVALCPDRDGGYALAALARPAPGLFDHPMSTASVLTDTLANARARGLRVHETRPGFDVDTIADLGELRLRRDGPAARLCPRTLAHCDANGLWNLLPGAGRPAR